MAIKSPWNVFKLILTCPFVIFFTTIGSCFLFSNLFRLEKNQVFLQFQPQLTSMHFKREIFLWLDSKFFPRPTSMHLNRGNLKWLDGKFSLLLKPTFSSNFSPLMSALSKMAIFNFLRLKTKLYWIFPTNKNVIS